jgi:uncharacterized protein DUF3152
VAHPPTTPEPVPAPLRRSSVVWVLAGLLALALVSGGTAYVIFKPTSGTPVFSLPGATATTTPAASPTPTATPSPTPTPIPSYAMNGPGTYVYAAGQSAVFGAAGSLKTYHVAVETGIPVTPDDFAGMVDVTLSDPRSWIAGKNVRLQRVPHSVDATFVVLLVTPGTAMRLCGAVGLDIVWHGEPYTSCQAGQQAVINLTRYLKSVPDYGASVYDYRQYAINHEVGHVLGHGHELCPAKGMPAPVMQQQTFSLQGCVANSWPYLNGKRYSGPPGRIVPQD